MGVSPLKGMRAKTIYTKILFWFHEYLFSWLNCWKFTFIGVLMPSLFVSLSFSGAFSSCSGSPRRLGGGIESGATLDCAPRLRLQLAPRRRSEQRDARCRTLLWNTTILINTQKSAHHSNVISFPWDSDEAAFYELQLALVGSCEWGRGERRQGEVE